MTDTPEPVETHDYYVDESGDGTLFDRKGKVLVGTPGCSRFFMLGMVDVYEANGFGDELEDLRARLLADPYFAGVPSMRLEAAKTAMSFHAKDDLPEVRREVFHLIRRFQFHFSAVVRDKLSVLDYVRSRNRNDATYRYHPNDLYDYMARRLLANRLHKSDVYNVYFARRGKSDRTVALREALLMADEHFCRKHGIQNCARVHVIPTTPIDCPGQQVVDYFLWALQRFFTSGESRYIDLIWGSVSVIHDLDDTRRDGYGAYYTRKRPLTRAALEGRLGI